MSWLMMQDMECIGDTLIPAIFFTFIFTALPPGLQHKTSFIGSFFFIDGSITKGVNYGMLLPFLGNKWAKKKVRQEKCQTVAEKRFSFRCKPQALKGSQWWAIRGGATFW